jgi:3-hydroxyacyl-CoA dehydrogenase/enoyl-CoA hydratase/3-hydroxybutyryl-CoA epimerase/enoyl-CoA isomerase
MIFQGKAIQVKTLDNGIAEMVFDLAGESVNKFNLETLTELKEAVAKLKAASGIKGLLVSSAKEGFIVGADISQFSQLFVEPEEKIAAQVEEFNLLFCEVEDLPFPTVSMINGVALGGGYEMGLATDYRVLASNATVGLPEAKLGINPGFGGTVRLPRLIGIDNAVEMIATGRDYKASAALAVGAVDAVVDPAQLRVAALDVLKQCIDGDFNWRARRAEKTSPVKLNDIEKLMAFTTGKGAVAGQAGPNFPAPLTAVKSMEKSVSLSRSDAIKVEAKMFARLAKTQVADAMVGLFLNEQALAKKAKTYSEKALPVKKAAVLGAGIMGGGIAYQSVSKGTPVIMKDIADAGLHQGLTEAAKLLSKQVDKGRMSSLAMADVLNKIDATLDYSNFGSVDIVVEAVVENVNVKQKVLAEVEQKVSNNAIIASNTSTISITRLAEALQRPQNFCGMHFFNPVHAMPLVEVIRGAKSSPESIATTVAYAKAMGKTPIVVNDCPGFFVNRVLFPYFAGFNLLLRDGADFRRVDKVMEKFGWPMGPAYLIDVVGADTAHHAAAVMAQGFPDRMQNSEKVALDVLYENKRFGQKNGKGFYVYQEDRKGKPVKSFDESVLALLAPVVKDKKEFSDEEIIARTMIPMCIEVVRCLEEGIVESAGDADMGLIMGIGFPMFRGGALRYLDHVGIANFCEQAKQYEHLGALYKPTAKMLEMAKTNARFCV